MNCCIIGSGNVATQLGKALVINGIEVSQVIGRTKKSTIELANTLHTNYSISIDDLQLVDLVIIAVNDNEIKNVATNLNKVFLKKYGVTKTIVVHTAASVGVDVLHSKYFQSGSLYPLQTFTKLRDVDFRSVPLFYFSTYLSTQNKLKKIASTLSNRVEVANDNKRKALHVAAVFTNNFTNCMIAVAQDICKKNKLDFNLLKPLMLETFSKLEHEAAAKIQTGPAKRGDLLTVKEHLKFLKNESYKKLYLISSQIILESNESITYNP